MPFWPASSTLSSAFSEPTRSPAVSSASGPPRRARRRPPPCTCSFTTRGPERRRDHRGAALEPLRLVRGRDLPHDPPAPGVRRDGGPTCPAKRASAPKRPGLRAPERPPKDSRQTSLVLHPRPTSGETGCEASRGTTPKPLLLRRPESRRAEVPKAVADGALARHRLEVAGLVGLPGNSLPSLSAIHSATPMRASRSIPVSCPMPRKR